MRPTTSPAGLAALALAVSTGCAQELADPEVGLDQRTLEMPVEARQQIEATRERMMAMDAPRVDPMLDRELVARAAADECFDQIGLSAGAPPCAMGTKPRINQTDITVGVRSGDFAYFGTTPNVVCLAAAGLFGSLAPFATDELVCEFGAGSGAAIGTPQLGDMRPPRVVRVDATTDRVIDLTPDDPLLENTIGLGGAGAYRDVVLLAGPNVGPDGLRGLNLFAYEGSTGELIGSMTLADYASMKSGVVVNGALYLGATKTTQPADVGGYVVKWTGDKFDPFRFEVVGQLGSPPVSLVEHQGRIAVSTHVQIRPDAGSGEMPGIYLSPVVPVDGGLKETDATRWTKIFETDDYEPDPVIARSTSISELASYGGRLFFGTHQAPLFQTLQAFANYGRPDTWWGRMFTHAHSERAASLFVMDDVGTSRRKVTLLYGEAVLPAFDPASGMFEARENNLRQEPLYGSSGFGNKLNHAIGALTVFEGRLYASTYDASAVLAELFGPMVAQERLLDLPADVVDVLQPIFDMAREELAGADLYRIDTPFAPAVAEDLSGLGNRSNHGVSVLVPFEDESKIFAGTSNAFNLRSKALDRGGFEILSLIPSIAEE